MKIRKGDQVKMIAGKDCGKQGKVLRVEKTAERVAVEGLNLLKKHRRPRKQGEKGQRVEIPAAVHISNVKLICPQCGKPTRVGYSLNENKKSRVCKKCQAEI